MKIVIVEQMNMYRFITAYTYKYVRMHMCKRIHTSVSPPFSLSLAMLICFHDLILVHFRFGVMVSCKQRASDSSLEHPRQSELLDGPQASRTTGASLAACHTL